LIGDIAQTEELAGCYICMMDINEARLNATCTLVKKYCQEPGVNLQIEKTMDSDEAIKDANFIINTAYPYPKDLEDGYGGWEIAIEIGMMCVQKFL